MGLYLPKFYWHIPLKHYVPLYGNLNSIPSGLCTLPSTYITYMVTSNICVFVNEKEYITREKFFRKVFVICYLVIIMLYLCMCIGIIYFFCHLFLQLFLLGLFPIIIFNFYWFGSMCTCSSSTGNTSPTYGLMGNGTLAIRDVSRTCSDPIHRPKPHVLRFKRLVITMFWPIY